MKPAHIITMTSTFSEDFPYLYYVNVGNTCIGVYLHKKDAELKRNNFNNKAYPPENQVINSLKHTHNNFKNFIK